MNTTLGWLAIGALSERTDCKVETIRFYERARDRQIDNVYGEGKASRLR